MEPVFLNLCVNVSGAGAADANGVYIADGATHEEIPIFRHKERKDWSIQVRHGEWSICIMERNGNVCIAYFIPKTPGPGVSAADAVKSMDGGWHPCWLTYRVFGLGLLPVPTVWLLEKVSRKRGPDIVKAVQDRVWKQRKFTDAEVVSDGVRIPVHRATLAAASPVFEAAFSSAMLEGRLAVYEIKESQPAAVEAMLRHIYTGKVEVASEALAPLLDLAVQYELEDLKTSVPEELLNGLTEENVRQRAEVLKRHRQHEPVDQALMKMLIAIESDQTKKLLLALI